MKSPDQCGLDCDTSSVSSPSPVKLLQLCLCLQVIPCMIGVLGHYDDNNTVYQNCNHTKKKKKEREVIQAERTDDVRVDASPCEQRCNL